MAMMSWSLACAGVLILLIVFADTFETIILPRTVSRRLRLTNIFLFLIWRGWRTIVRAMPPRLRESWLSGYAPLSLVFLIVLWALLLTIGFALLQMGLDTPMNADHTFPMYLYMSGTTLFTLGYGDLTPLSSGGRMVAVVESGVGFGFLALVISYLPVLYQSFSRREVAILLLDSRAGSPPVAGDLLTRNGDDGEELIAILAEFERWCAGVLESFLSFPILAYYRSQHDRLTWLSAVTVMLDTCALIQLEFRERAHWEKRLHKQAEHTYAMARHVIVDVAYILSAAPMQPSHERLPPEEFRRLHQRLEAFGLKLHASEDSLKRLSIRRREYEPYLYGLAHHLMLSVPPIWREVRERDSWQTSAWDGDGHF
jgi:predicted nucleic acid-binding protein